MNPWLGLDAARALPADGRGRARRALRADAHEQPGRARLPGARARGRRAASTSTWRARSSPHAKRLAGASGWSGLGLVVGATHARGGAPRARRRADRRSSSCRATAPRARAREDAVASFVRGAGGRREGGLVNAARGAPLPGGRARRRRAGLGARRRRRARPRDRRARRRRRALSPQTARRSGTPRPQLAVGSSGRPCSSAAARACASPSAWRGGARSCCGSGGGAWWPSSWRARRLGEASREVEPLPSPRPMETPLDRMADFDLTEDQRLRPRGRVREFAEKEILPARRGARARGPLPARADPEARPARLHGAR